MAKKRRLAVNIPLGDKLKKKVQVALEDEETIEFARKWSFLLGLSLDKACEALVLGAREEVEGKRLLLSESTLKEEITVQEFISGLQGHRTSTQSQLRISLNMALTQYPEANDPIMLTLPKVAEAWGHTPADFLKQLFIIFLRANGFISEEFQLTEPDSYKIILTDVFEPFGWSYNPWLDLEAINAKALCYSFLSPGPYRHTNPVTVYWKEPIDNLVFASLPIICKVLFRDTSSFFQMLYMYFLKGKGILNEDFELIPNWDISIRGEKE